MDEFYGTFERLETWLSFGSYFGFPAARATTQAATRQTVLELCCTVFGFRFALFYSTNRVFVLNALGLALAAVQSVSRRPRSSKLKVFSEENMFTVHTVINLRNDHNITKEKKDVQALQDQKSGLHDGFLVFS